MRITSGWLLDGRGGPVLRDAHLEVSRGIIQAIHEGSKQKETSADRDLSSCTILPGLVDCHVHLSLSGTEDLSARKNQLSSPFPEAMKRIESHLAVHLAHGTMAVRDGGDRQGHVLLYKQTCLQRKDESVRVLSAGQAWHALGRYGAMIGRTPLENAGLAGSILGTGAGDLIKIINSGPNSLSEFGKETPSQFSLRELEDAVRAGHSQGRKIMVHANGRQAVQSAIEAGCDSIEHGYFMGKENLRRLADRGIPWIPTVFAMQTLVSNLLGTEAETAKRNVDHQLEQIRLAMGLGVIICAGTDAGSLGVHHGEALIEELRLLMTAGMSLEKAVLCASSNAAAMLGLEGYGSIESGAAACLVAVQGGPERLPDSLKTAEWIL